MYVLLYRSRRVAKENNTCKIYDWFVATPPLEANKLLLAFPVTEGIGHKGSKTRGVNVDFIDLKSACCRANVRR